jgi:hypothetical protein
MGDGKLNIGGSFGAGIVISDTTQVKKEPSGLTLSVIVLNLRKEDE